MSDTITVQTNSGPREVAVLYRKGAFALHACLDQFFGPYTVTHVPTGRYVDYVRTRGAGRSLIRILQADKSITWDFTDLNRSGREAQYERLLAARRAVRP
jgi:hypothetical protein